MTTLRRWWLLLVILLAAGIDASAQNGLIVSGTLFRGSSDEKGYYMIGSTSADGAAIIVMFNPKAHPTMVRNMERLLDGPIELTIRRP